MKPASNITVKFIALSIAFVAGVTARPALLKIRDRFESRSNAAPDAPKDYAYYLQRKTHFEDLKKVHPVVFLGDSRVQGCEWWELLGSDAANRGINGDTVSGVKDRIAGSVPEGTQLCVIQLGFNDVAAGVPAHKIADGLCTIARDVPASRKIITSIIPATGQFAHLNPKIAEANRITREEVLKAKFEWLDLTPVFGHELSSDFTSDGIHPNGAGYRALAAFLTEPIKNALNDK